MARGQGDASAKFPQEIRLFDSVMLRLGGNLNGKAGGDLQEFIFRIDDATLGTRPPIAEQPAIRSDATLPHGGGGASVSVPAPVSPAAAPEAQMRSEMVGGRRTP